MFNDNTPQDRSAKVDAVELDDVQLDNVAAGAVETIAVSHDVTAAAGQAVFADGSVRFLQSSTDLVTLQRLSTRDDGIPVTLP